MAGLAGGTLEINSGVFWSLVVDGGWLASQKELSIGSGMLLINK